MKQQIKLGNDGVIMPGKTRVFVPGEATRNPAKKVGRLQQLLKTGSPHICILRGEGIGDVIMTTPVVSALKTAFPGTNITYATNTSYLNGALVKTLQYNPDIDQIVDNKFITESDYDLVANLHCPCVGYEKRENPPLNRIDIFANHLGVKLIDPVPRYYIQPNEIEEGEKFLGVATRDKLVMIQPSASSQKRSIDHGKLKQAAMALYKNYRVRSVIVTHSSDWGTDILWDNLPNSIPLRNADIRKIASVMVHCDLVLCPDSSIMHLAGALGVPTVALFGPTHPAARINYYENTVAIWEGEGLAPCPCWNAACPVKEACWGLITPERIVQGCMQHIEKTQRVDIARLRKASQKVVIETEAV
jgi:ADP-heptose:LPS heptosyltransferase